MNTVDLRRRRPIAALLVAAIALGSCAAPQLVTPPPTATACGVPSYSCALPYPSSRFEIADATTATGVRIELPSRVLAAGLAEQLGPGASLSEAASGADGFSPLSPIVFQAPDGIDPDSVPTDGGALVTVSDGAGRRQAVRAEVSSEGTDDRGRRGVLLVWPVTHWPLGQRITATVGDGLRSPEGRSTRLWESTTNFMVATNASITGEVDRLASVVRSDEHPVRGLVVSPSLLGGAALLTGQVAVTDFRDRNGVIPRLGQATGRRLWVDFLMTLPERPASDRGAPVAIYGHGISISKETAFIVAGQNAQHGVATIAIDVPLHGSRVPADGYLFDLIQPTNLGRIAAMILQGELDLVSLLDAVQTSLATLDTLPLRIDGRHGDDRPDLDVNRIYYQGTSMGGFLGTTFVGLAPELKGAFVQVGGAGIIDTIFHSVLWGAFRGLMPVGAPPGDAHALIAGAQQLMDRSDPTYYLDRIRRAGTPFFLVYATNDGVVGNPMSGRVIELGGLPRTAGAVPQDGRGVLEIAGAPANADPLRAFLAHTQFTSPASVAALDGWWDRMLALA